MVKNRVPKEKCFWTENSRHCTKPKGHKGEHRLQLFNRCGEIENGKQCRLDADWHAHQPCWFGETVYVVIDYTNHRGERAERTISPRKIWFGFTQWHREKQWMLNAVDLDKGAERDFAMSSIHSWKPLA